MPQPCTLCGDLVYGRDTHPCCDFWRDLILAGHKCPACSVSKTAAQRRAGIVYARERRDREREQGLVRRPPPKRGRPW